MKVVRSMPNRLNRESSPYLRQHRDNPVDWYPWSQEALDLAYRRDCMVLLSIGYSACHWCHVMARESFADERIAGVMNELFVNIKVDREERPDLDRIYQLAHQVLTRQPGGWPLTIFLHPRDQIPVFSGTYFPPVPRHGMPAFGDFLRKMGEAWVQKRKEFDSQGRQVAQMFVRMSHLVKEPRTAMPGREVLQQAREELGGNHDPVAGGFGRAPKFPMVTSLEWLLRHWHMGGRQDRDAVRMVRHSLAGMAKGGIFDHLGGGFFRYATDRDWMIPHFEKMLYDNGLLLSVYADAVAMAPDNRLFVTALERTAIWMMEHMQTDEGGYCAALDADSEGQEGHYYLWSRHEVEALLDEQEYLLVETLFGLDKPANFEGHWILHRHDAWPAVVRRLDMDLSTAEAILQRALAKMMAHRAEREPPHLDHKIICAWNGLAIKGMVKAGERLQRDDFIDSAVRAVDFLYSNLWREGRLYSVWTEGHCGTGGFLDDHAFLLDALLTLLQSRWNHAHANFALDLAHAALDRFRDPVGSFYFTASDHEPLIYRPRPMQDDSLPAANAVLADAFLRLGHLSARPEYLKVAEDIVHAAHRDLTQAPEMHASLLGVLEALHHPFLQVILTGPGAECDRWRKACLEGYHPERVCYAIAHGEATTGSQLLSWLPVADAGRRDDVVRAHVCTEMSCREPITELDELLEVLMQWRPADATRR